MIQKHFQKINLIAIAITASTMVSTGVVSTPIIHNQQRALAGVDLGIDQIVSSARNFWRNYYAVNYLQVYYARYSSQQVQQIKRQYGSSASSVFHNGCKVTFYSWQNAQGWQKAIIDPFAWFFFVQREENGVVNCYMRKPQN
ncbi:MAG: hypothetical protein V7L01_33630 [Nostoc sp.]|uniref:hypothetical protein n=1 Tax=Nostoc sp. TaxID=1180 RepID=UPI002FFC4460